MSVPEPSKILTPWATSGLKNTIPAASNPVTGNAGYDQGFPAINMTPKEAGGIPPFGQDFNGILFSITEVLRYMQAGGQPTFDAALADAIGGYPKGATVLGSDGMTQWHNQVDGNSSNPNSWGSGWIPVVPLQYPVGAPIPWPTAVPPSGFLAMTGQSFSATTYPKLALAYPALVLPDLRGEFIRGWDNGRGVNPGRVILSLELDELKSHNHQLGVPVVTESGTGLVGGVTTNGNAYLYETLHTGGIETRPRSMSFNFITRAA